VICPNCGLEISDKANFCDRCGTPVSPQGAAAAAGRPATAADNVTPAGAGAAGRGAGSESEYASNYVLSSPPDQTPERILWDEYPSMRTAIPGIVVSVVIGVILIVGLQFIPFRGNRSLQWIISGIIAVIVLADISRHYIRLHSTKYRLSTQRLFITHGLVNKRTDEVELEKYKDIFVNQDFWDNIVGCGDIEVVTSDATNPTIRIIDVVDPIGKKETIRAAARERKSVLGITRREEL